MMIVMTIDHKINHSDVASDVFDLLHFAQIAFDEQDWVSSIGFFEEYLLTNRGNPRIYYTMAQCYEALEKYEEANEFYRRC